MFSAVKEATALCYLLSTATKCGLYFYKIIQKNLAAEITAKAVFNDSPLVNPVLTAVDPGDLQPVVPSSWSGCCVRNANRLLGVIIVPVRERADSLWRRDDTVEDDRKPTESLSPLHLFDGLN